MMFVAVRYYQQSMESYNLTENDADDENFCGEQRKGVEFTPVDEVNKMKKKF